MTSARRTGRLREAIAEALADTGDVVVFAHGRPEYVWLEAWPQYVAARSDPGDADLSPLGWREPQRGQREWRQYFQPRGARMRRSLASFAVRALVAGAGIRGGLDLVTQARTAAQAPAPLFAVPPAGEGDRDLLHAARAALEHAPFELSAYPGHLELTARRGRGQRTDLGVIARSGTLTAFALHLVDPETAIVNAHLAANRSLDHVPYSYGVRPLCRHRRALVLESKVAVPVHPAAGPMVGMALHGLLEPLIDCHHTIRTATA